MKDIFDFEELIANMLDVPDKEREDVDYLPSLFYDTFDIDFDSAYILAKRLLMHTPQVQAGLTNKHYHAFVSKDEPVMLMKLEVKNTNEK